MNKLKAAFGWIGSLCLMFSGAPAALEAIQRESCSVPVGTLTLWTIGEIGLLIYLLPKIDKVLLTNYLVNLIFLIPVWYYLIIGG
jgi:hypothetical protein